MYQLNIFDSGAPNHTWFEVTKVEKNLAYVTRYARSNEQISRDYICLQAKDDNGHRTVMLKDGHLWVENWVWNRKLTRFGPRVQGSYYGYARYQAKRTEHATEVRRVKRELTVL
ncbi:MAG: hypothetical protein PHQ43_08165 [Dehalococcoidales bacterium]|jgi:hypothetical protein|nr:hypothetical protein [Dehalococcoidales bacterium]